MLHHQHDKGSEMNGTLNRNNTVSHRHSHTHLSLKPTVVLDHIKTKVKRKRTPNHSLAEIPAFVTNNNINGNNIPKRSSEEHDVLESKQSSTSSRSQPIISTQRLSDQCSDGSCENKNNEENNVCIEKNENNATVSDHLDKDEDTNETVQWRLSPIETDTDNNQKNIRSKSKTHRVSKSVSEFNNQSNIKKRRRVPSSSKMQFNNKNKRNDRHNMESSPYSTGFPIRDEDFNNIFSDLPSDEQLIVAYPCAWRKDILMHGRIFLSVNYVCFYTGFFKSEESLCIAYKDTISVTREKSAKVIPNAIQLRTKNGEQYVFVSYIPRERIFTVLFRLWQNSLFEKPLGYQQLRAIVSADQISIDESTADSEQYTVPENNDENIPDRSQSLPSIPLDPSRESSTTLIQSDKGMVSSLPSDSNKEQKTYLSSCPCETHLARTYADRSFSYHVDQLFELTYGDNSFTRAFHDSQKLTDYTIGKWRINDETGKRERQVTYKTVTQSILGTNTISCTEKQIIEAEKPRLLYVINTEVFNEGMKYTDAFFVATRFCMFQRDAKKSSLRITAEVRYVKSVNGIARSFIEKNCHSSIEDGVNNQIRRLDNHQATISNRKFDRRQTSVSKQSIRKKRSEDTIPDEQKDISSINQVQRKEKSIIGKGSFFDIAIFIGIFLLFLHIYLCYKLYSIDDALHNPDRICLNRCRKECLSNKTHP